jgi:spermidine synthase
MRSLLVILLFVGSGFAALVYEVVWFQLLRLVIGASSLSLGILLASFMGGMCLGSLCLPLLVPARFHPLRVYASLELALGAIGCSLPYWLPRLSDWYVRHAAESITGVSARAVVAGIVLVPPAMLMGATLPAVARWVKNTPGGMSQLGFFYGGNLAGAVLGCLAAGFVLLPRTDVFYASNVAAAVNVMVAAMAVALAYCCPHHVAEVQSSNPPASAGGYLSRRFGIVAALSGFAALTAEVVWTRSLSMLFGSTVYTFAILLAIFLSGLGIGSALAAGCVRWNRHPWRWLVVAQLAIVVLVPYANHMITGKLPYLSRPEVATTSAVNAVFAHDTWRAAIAILPAAIFWGASFPLTLAAARIGHDDLGRFVGRMYAANTVGAVLGSLLASTVLIPVIGSRSTQQIIVLVSGLAAVLAIGAGTRLSVAGSPAESDLATNKWQHAADGAFRSMATRRGLLTVIALLAVSMLCVTAPPEGMFGRSLEPYWWRRDGADDVFLREGRSTTVVVQKRKFGDIRYLCVGGKVEASNLQPDMRNQFMLGHLPALLHPAAKKTLTVGLGTGMTAGSFVLHPEIEQIAICEIEPAVREAANAHFRKENNAVVEDRRTEIHFDDARHFLATTNERFDIITSDPVNSWIRGASTLYSREYYELCKRHLNPNGVMVQWIPLYEKDRATAKCELATFLRVFQSATLWTSWTNRDGHDERHDLIVIGQVTPATIDLAELERRINSNSAVNGALEQVNLGTIPELVGQFVCRGEDLKPWLEDAEINQDRSLRLEYLAGLSLWMKRHNEIFREIAAFRRYPADLFENDAAYKDEILRRLHVPAAGP